MPNKDIVQKKIEEAKDTLKKGSDKNLMEEVVLSVTKKIDEKMSLLEEVTTLTEELNNIKNYSNELKHKNEELTINIQEATSEIEHLMTALEESEHKRLNEVELLETQNAQLTEELELVSVRLQVHDLLEEKICLRVFSDKLYNCKSVRDLQEKVAILEGFELEDDSRSVSRILRDIQESKSKGASNITELQKSNAKLTATQRAQKYLAGQLDEQELTFEEKENLKV